MTNEEIEDIVFTINIYLTTSRINDAIHLFKELIDIDPAFDNTRRLLFHATYKTVIDEIRSVLLVLNTNLELESSVGNLERVKFIEQRKEQLIERLINYSTDAIELIDSQLCPAAPDVAAHVFYIKLKADFYRYVTEYSDEAEASAALETASTMYKEALDLCATHFTPVDPLRLSVILNAAVFRYNQRQDFEGASEMLKQALNNFNEAYRELSPEQQKETTELVQLMTENIQNWSSDL